MLNLIAITLFSILPVDGTSYDSVDYIEFNNYVQESVVKDDDGNPIAVNYVTVFKQIIAWKYDEEIGKYVIKDWRLYRGKQWELPIKANGYWRVPWEKGEGKIPFSVKSSRLVKTTTLFDPELENRKVLPENKRVKIFNPNTLFEKSVMKP